MLTDTINDPNEKSFKEALFNLRAKVLGIALDLHRMIGPGLLESAYQKMLAINLNVLGYNVETEVYYDILFMGHRIERAYRADLVVNGMLIVELKATEKTNPLYLKQVNTYIQLANLPYGLLLNFGMYLRKEVAYRIDNLYYNPKEAPILIKSQNQKHLLKERTFIQTVL